MLQKLYNNKNLQVHIIISSKLYSVRDQRYVTDITQPWSICGHWAACVTTVAVSVEPGPNIGQGCEEMSTERVSLSIRDISRI